MSCLPREPSGKIADPGNRFEPLLDSDEAADLLKIHPKTLQRMARRGDGGWNPDRKALALPCFTTQRVVAKYWWLSIESCCDEKNPSSPAV